MRLLQTIMYINCSNHVSITCKHVFQSVNNTLLHTSGIAPGWQLQTDSQGEGPDGQDGHPGPRLLQLHPQPLLVHVLQQHSQAAYLEREREREREREGGRGSMACS